MGRFFSHIDASWWSPAFLIVFVVFFAGLIVYWYNPKRRAECEKFSEIPLQED